ncbi:MAG: hypothetical protein Q9210_002216 [Variospora velana]
MAPKRKNKKPASNLARGFATVSTVSKSKSVNESATEDIASQSVPDQDNVPQDSTNSRVVVEKEVHQLSPEQLEQHLEESELNLFLEKHGERVKRDVSRQINKLQTEKRLIRAQAEPLQLRSWLSPEIMGLIVEAIEAEQPAEGTASELRGVSDTQGDDLNLRIWTLQQVLCQLGFPYDLCLECLHHLLYVMQDAPTRERLEGKDSIWGLECSLDWLALHCKPQQVPSYTRNNSEKAYRSEMEQWDDLRPDSESDFALSGSPLASAQPHGIDGIESTCTKRALTPTDSDTESDVDPDAMTDRYVDLQTSLYELETEQGIAQPQVLSKTESRPEINWTEGSRSQFVKILSRLERLKSDILFDQYDADRKWTEKRNELAKAAAQRRKLQLHDGKQSGSADSRRKHANGVATLGSTHEAHDEPQDDIGVEALGDFFSGLPDIDSPHVTDSDIQGLSNLPLHIRDFGTWNGMSPTRLLSDACKARDSSSRITYQLVDRSPFSKQHTVNIFWSCNQPPPLQSPTEALSCSAGARRVQIAMHTEATPDSLQSEAYVSTAALFLVFSSVPKEEKASLRLPPVWKVLWTELAEFKKQHDMALDREELRVIRELVEAGPSLGVHTLREQEDSLRQTPQPTATPALPEEKPESGKNVITPDELKVIWSHKSNTPSFSSMLQHRKCLPIWTFKDEILQTMSMHSVIIICGETGCGKSTQVPSFILEHELSRGMACKVYCTEPRRISAISLARRVSEELGERKSEVGTSRSLIGYAIRLESRLVRETRLVYATTGIVIRMLESDGLQEITHLILDEVHERSLESDFLLIVLRRLLVKRPSLKVVLMSATVDAAKFQRYFNGAPILTVPGRTFPVEIKYLEDALEETRFTNSGKSPLPTYIDDEDDEDADGDVNKGEQRTKDGRATLAGYNPRTRSTIAYWDEYHINYDLVVSLLEMIASKPKFSGFSKAILVFLPGIAEIRRLNDMVAGQGIFSHGWDIHVLASSIAIEEQERAFSIPTSGRRKLVISTNIAETGVTIPDITCVIDTGKHKEMSDVDEQVVCKLVYAFVSSLELVTIQWWVEPDSLEANTDLFQMAEEMTPEMLRLSLQDLVLRVKICKLGSIEETLAEALDAPSKKNIRRAIDALIDVKALTAAEGLTPLGRQLAKLPLDVFLGKLILLGCIFKCLDAAITIGAILSSKSPFSAPMGARSQADQARLAFRKGESDLLTVYNAYCSWRRTCNTSGASEQQFCRKNYLSQQNLANIEELKGQLATSLVEAGFLELREGEDRSIKRYLHHQFLLGMLFPATYHVKAPVMDIETNLRRVAPKMQHECYRSNGQLSNLLELLPKAVEALYNAHETGAVEPFALALACGDADFKMYSGVIVIDGNRIRFSVDDWQVMLAIKTLRQALRQITAQMFRHPGYWLPPHQQKWMGIWEKIFAYHEESTAGVKNIEKVTYIPSTFQDDDTQVVMMAAWAALSPFEELILGAEKPTAMLVHLFHPLFHDSIPAGRLLSFLPRASIINLRRVSRTTKAWVEEHHPALLTRLQVVCPLQLHALENDSTLHQLSHDCSSLTIEVLPSSKPMPAGTFLSPSPAGQIFKIVSKMSSLCIVPPAHDAFEPVLSLRLALESSPLKSLTHIHVEPLDIASLLALRWGAFAAFKDSTWTAQSVWRGMKSFRVGMTDDWLRYAHRNLESEQDERHQMRMKEEREFYRQAVQALHNYFFQFAVHGTLGRLHFEWLGGDVTGLNPLLLDEEAAKEGGGKWFSAPGTKWKGLKEVWLGGAHIDGTSIQILQQRLDGLERLMVSVDLAAPELNGNIQTIDGKEWLDVDLKPAIQATAELEEHEDIYKAQCEGTGGRAESMVVPFVLKI